MPVSGADARILQNLCIGISEQQVGRGRTHRHRKIRGLEMGKVVKSRRGGGSRTRTAGSGAACIGRSAGRLQGNPDAAGPGDAQCLLPVFAHFEDGDVHHHLGTRLVQVVDQLFRQQKFVRRGSHHDGVLAGHGVDLGAGQHVANGGLHVGQVILLPRIRQVEGLHRLLIQLRVAGAGVGGHKDGVLGHRPPEGIRDGANNAQRVQQRDAVQVNLNAFGGEFRIEEDVDSGGFAHRLVYNLGVFLHVQSQRLVGDRPEDGRRAHRVQSLLFALDLGYAGLVGGRHLAVLLPHPGDILLGSFVAGVDLAGVQKFGQRPLLVAGIQHLLPLGHMHRCGRAPHAVEGGPVAQIFGSFVICLLIIVESRVVVLVSLGGFAALEQGAGRLGAQLSAGEADDHQDDKKSNPACGS